MSRPRSHRHLLLSGGTVVTMDAGRRVERADVLVTDGVIAAVGTGLDTPPATRLLDVSGKTLLPGFVQGHVHLGQTLFKGLAEDRELLPWLKDRIWPLEAAHTEESAYWSGMLGAADCLLAGTTTIHEIGLVKGMEGIFRAIRDSGIRAVAGKCLMDEGEGVPAVLAEETPAALAEAREFHDRWHGAADGRIRAALCPRFILSCSPEMWGGTMDLARDLDLPVHTHLLESPAEEEAVKRIHGEGQMAFLDRMGVLDGDLRIAHGVWFDEEAEGVLAGRRMGVVHCPSANLKLGSGIADLVRLRSVPNLAVGIGCDGAPCNNDLDILEEMRLAGLLQAYRQGPGRVRSLEILELATCEGARAIGLDREIGSIEPGKRADITVLDLERPGSFGGEAVSVYDRIVYGAARDAVSLVIVDGEILVRNGELVQEELARVLARAREEVDSLASRAELG